MKALAIDGRIAREPVPAAVLREFPVPSRSPMASSKPCLFPIAALALPGVLAFMLFLAAMPMARAVPNQNGYGIPQAFDAAACHQLVQNAGRAIAWMRWEVGAPEESVVAQFDDGTPEWIIDLTSRWIEDAYDWQVTDDQVQQWASELGDGAARPRAEQLTTPQTIAIWLRRIARQCHELHV